MRDDRTDILADESAPHPGREGGIRAEKPAPAWERPDCFRPDCEPHRGEILWWLGCASYLFGLGALFPCIGWVPGLVGAPIGLMTWLEARRDLARMRTGLTDPGGRPLTTEAASVARLGFWLSLAGAVAWGAFIIITSL
jgi:hypothetical protein